MTSTYWRTLQRSRQILAATIALGLAFVLVAGSTGTVAASEFEKKSAKTKLTENRKIIHLLNRIGYGPRPGDIERVKRIGIERYIEAQLNSGRIDDAATEARLNGFESLRMDLARVYDKYPAPQIVARRLGLQPGNQAAPQGPEGTPEEREEQREAREKIFEYYSSNNLRPPQLLLQELQAQKFIRAVYSERQLQEVMTDFWFNHFNIFWAKGADRWLTADFEMNAIRPNTMGKFKDLVLATAKSPAMLFYLDNFQSSAPGAKFPGEGMMRRRMQRGRNPQNRRFEGQRRPTGGEMPAEEERQAINEFLNRPRGINENYARELMELHTLGVDGGYTQKDVQEVARAFTGWTIEQPRRSGRFVFRSWMHDDGEKLVLGQKIASGGGMKDGERVIEILARHPSTARFIATKLARRFVSDDPPKSLVDRVAATYTKTEGDIREMLKAILTSPEFFSPDAYRAKIKSPFELAVSTVRALDGQTNGAPPISQLVSRMGQPLYLYQAPTGYPDTAEQWVNTGALLERLNFGLAISANRVPGTVVNVKADRTDADAVLDKAVAVLLHGEVSSQTRSVLKKQFEEGVPVKGEISEAPQMRSEGAMMGPDPFAGRPQQRRGPGGQNRRGLLAVFGEFPRPEPVDPQVARIFGLVLGSPEFQRR